MNFHTYLSDDLSEAFQSRCKSEGISIAAYLRRLVLQDLKRPQFEKLKPAEEILDYLNRKASGILTKAFYSTPNNLAAAERVREKYKPDIIRRAIDTAIFRKFTREQLKPESLFLPENFEKLLEENKESKPAPSKKFEKAAEVKPSALPPAKKTGLDPQVERERAYLAKIGRMNGIPQPEDN